MGVAGWIIQWQPRPSKRWLPCQVSLDGDCLKIHPTRDSALADLADLRAKTYDGPRGKWRIRKVASAEALRAAGMVLPSPVDLVTAARQALDEGRLEDFRRLRRLLAVAVRWRR